MVTLHVEVPGELWFLGNVGILYLFLRITALKFQCRQPDATADPFHFQDVGRTCTDLWPQVQQYLRGGTDMFRKRPS